MVALGQACAHRRVPHPWVACSSCLGRTGYILLRVFSSRTRYLVVGYTWYGVYSGYRRISPHGERAACVVPGTLDQC